MEGGGGGMGKKGGGEGGVRGLPGGWAAVFLFFMCLYLENYG